MTYEGERVSGDGSTTLPPDGRVPAWTWQAVQERMAEAMRHWWRSHDSEARFNLGGRISSVWQSYFPDRADLTLWGSLVDLETAEPKPLPLSRADMARMVEASEWLAHVRAGDRRLVVLVLAYLARGEKKVPWLKLKRRMGVDHGADGLRKRYSRAITDVATVLNGGKPRR
jgi:hypothetical protein